ncbi:hypothetical protein JCM8547_007571, partial [Rhodosporidiobolus lusitaniae]
TREIVRQASLSGTAEARSPASPVAAASEKERVEKAGPSQQGGGVASFSPSDEQQQRSTVAFPSLPSPPTSTPASTTRVNLNPPLPFLRLRTSSSSSSSHLSPFQPAARSGHGHGYTANASSSPTPPRPSLTQSNSSSSFSTSASHHHLPPPVPSSPPHPAGTAAASQAFYLHHPDRARLLSAQSASQVEGYSSRSNSARVPLPPCQPPSKEEEGEGGAEGMPPLESTGGSGYESTVDPMMHDGRRRAESSVLERG